jgi:hypothetical protein
MTTTVFGKSLWSFISCAAMKGAKNELKGLEHIKSAHIAQLFAPFVALVS